MREEKEFYVWTRLSKKWFVAMVIVPIILLVVLFFDNGFNNIPVFRI